MKEESLNFEKVWLMFQKTDERLNKLALESEKTEKQLRESKAETDRYIKELSIQIGGVHRSFGKFTEEIFMSSLEIMMKSNFGIQSFDPNPSRKLDSDSIE
ncbi:MAG: hypothetical protein NTW25_09365, partial [Candidatus Kapabacteria bacterium]|nr:hypothetical protein [Candidatus Kapabacteria bacterium]